MTEKSSESNVFCEGICTDMNPDVCVKDFFMKLSEQNDNNLKAKSLKSFICSYLFFFKEQPQIGVKSDILLDLLSKVSDVSEKCLLPCEFNNQTKCVTENELNENLESAGLCFDIMQQCLEAFCGTKQAILVIKFALNILLQSYTHCKESEVIYGNIFEQFVDSLGIFLKRNISSLEKVLLQQLKKLNTDFLVPSKLNSVEINEFHIITILPEMGNLCKIVSNLDGDGAFELWSTYIKIICNHHKYLKQNSSTDSVLTYLALKNLEIIEMCKFYLDKNSEEDEKIATRFSFYLESLSNILNFVQSSNEEQIKEFKVFLVNFYDFLIVCYSPLTLGKISLDTIKGSIMKNGFVLSSHFYTSEDFLRSLLSLDSPVVGTDELHMGCILLKLCALQFMKCVPLQLKKDFFKNILMSFLLNNTEANAKMLLISIPQCAVSETDSVELVVLYQFAYEQISLFLKSLPEKDIEDIENIFLEYLETSSGIINLLISDVWMYLLRCSSMKFLEDQCHSMLKKYTMKTRNYKIENFIKRMLKFLPHCYKEQLLQEFPSLQFILDDKKIQHRYGIPDLYSAESEIFNNIDEKIKVLLPTLNECCRSNVHQMIQKACSCLELCTLFVNIADSAEILLFIQFAAHMFKSDVYDIQIGVLSFIKALSRKHMPENTDDFVKIIISMSKLFSEAIHSKNYIVQFEALNTFSYFAKCTPHVRIVQETVRQDPSLKPLIRSHISAVPDNGFLSEKEKLAYLQLQISRFTNISISISDDSKHFLQNVFSK